MFGRKPKVDTLKLAEAKLLVLDRILEADPEEPEMATLLERLAEIEELQTKNKQRIDINTALLVGGNLLGVLLIVGYEHAHVVTSKATGFVLKPK